MKTDIEINKALALAIGWPEEQVHAYNQSVFILSYADGGTITYRRFDYRDWNVISPIAKRYNAFPYHMHGYWETSMDYGDSEADTPQKAIAMAVIAGARP